MNIETLARDLGGIPHLEAYELLEKLDIPTPGWKNWTREEYAEIKKIAQDFLVHPSLQVGADPEFEIRN